MGRGIMRSLLVAVGGILVITLSGCAAQLERSATREVEAQCAAKGMQLAKTSAERKENLLVAKAIVMGECVGADDPRYVKAIASTN
jgi:hypothetical protein